MSKNQQNPQQLGSGPIDASVYDMMNALARGIESVFNDPGKPKETGWVLMAFPFGDKIGRCNYISNANREDIITLLTEQLSYFKGMPEHDPAVRPQ
jgi:hypothetical protein